MESAKSEFQKRYKKDEKFRPDRCTACGLCESKCPNGIPVSRLMTEVMELMAVR
jgi:ferredoxin